MIIIIIIIKKEEKQNKFQRNKEIQNYQLNQIKDKKNKEIQ